MTTESSNSRTETSFRETLRRVFDFETDVYEEVATRPDLLPAVCAVALAAPLSGSIFTVFFFFIAIPVMFVVVGVSACLVMIAARLFTGKSRPFGEWYRALAFAQAPLMIGIVPVVGTYIASVYCMAAQVAVVAQLAGVSIRRAILTVLLAIFLPLIVFIALLMVFGVFGGLLAALGGTMN